MDEHWAKMGQTLLQDEYYFPANIYLFKVNNKNPRKRCEI